MKNHSVIKRIIAVLMAVVTAAGCCVYAFAFPCGNPSTSIPTILISGDAVPIYSADGTLAYSTKEITKMVKTQLQDENGDIDYSIVIDKVMGILAAYYVQGCLGFNFNEYYQRIYDAVYPLVGDAHLDNNGENTNGSYPDPGYINRTKDSLTQKVSSYNIQTYQFYYDWRLDPLSTADELNTYIKAVKELCGVDKVCVICRCLGANLFLSYVSKYGMDDIYGVGFDGVTVNGCEILSEPVAGKFEFDPDAINRLLLDLEATDKLGDLDPTNIVAAVDTLDNSGIIAIAKFMIKFPNYNRIIKGITSALSLGTFYTWVNYWDAMSSEDFETAKEYVFGSEGSAKRQEYAGLIEKIDNYDVQVRQRIPELLDEINDNANFCIISKYGFQCSAISQSNDKVGDQLISAERSSFGATTAKLGGTLSDDYIVSQVAAGKAKYISPDLQIDASTCQFPDQTFFIKGASHSDWTWPEMNLLVKVITADHQLTIDDLPDNQFMVYDYATATAPAMTEDNCHTEAWTTDQVQFTKNIWARVKANKEAEEAAEAAASAAETTTSE